MPYVLHAISGCVLLVYGIVLIRSRPAFAVTEDRPPGTRGDGHLRDGFAVGVAATLLNPSAVVTWVVIVGGHATGVGRMEGAAWVLGIVFGTFAWFMVVTFLALRGRRVLRRKAAWMTRVVAALVLVTGLYSLGRAVVPLLHAR